jgi:hypothetical protein
MNARHKRTQLNVRRLEDRTVPALLLNELYVNPPGPDDNREFVEIRSTTGGVTSLSGVVLVEVNGDPGTTGVITHDNHLSGLTTGSNGLLLMGPNYASIGTPWGNSVSAGTALADKNNFMPDNNLTMLLVTGYTGVVGQDLDTNNDGTLDVTPWTSVLDSVGWFDPSFPGGHVYSPAVLTQPTLTPDAASRFANNTTALSTAAWYNGEMLPQGGVPDMTRLYNSADASANLPPNGQITPGNVNMSGASAPRVVSTRINDGSAQRSRVTSLDVTFSSQVNFAGAVANAFTLQRIGGGAVSFAATATLQGGVTVVTINNFTGAETQFGSLADGRYSLVAIASQISSPGGPLDGDGNGVGGDNYTFGDAQGLFRFFGDTNGDRHVDISDFGQFSSTFNLNSTQTGYQSQFDWNGDGRIDIADFGQFSIRFFTTPP